MAGERTKHILEPAGTEDLLRGWLLHAHMSRDRHDLAARRYEWRRYLFGELAIALSAVAGSSVFASIGETLEAPWSSASASSASWRPSPRHCRRFLTTRGAPPDITRRPRVTRRSS